MRGSRLAVLIVVGLGMLGWSAREANAAIAASGNLSFGSVHRGTAAATQTVDITSDVTGQTNVHAGRAVPESCTIDNTVEGLSYTIVMQTFSVPIDDNRLGYGLLVTRGGCDEFNELFGGAADERYGRECVIRGESIRPGSAQGDRAAEAGLPSPTWLGDEKPTWDLSVEAENAYCNENLRAFCTNEADSVEIQGDACSWEDEPTEVTGELRRCFCGDVLDTPSGGGF